MKFQVMAFAAALSVSPAPAAIVINEVFMNPPGSFDSTREFIELYGTPGMKLDGYAIAVVNGALTRFYPLGSIPPEPVAQEIDEFFSLDGLQLGRNGLLVIGVGVAANYPTLLPDTNFQRWNTLWNGLLDSPGQLQNDGANTFFLIRNRPGATQADPANPLGLRWGKDITHDAELLTPVVDPQDGLTYDQFGDGSLDRGLPNNYGGNTLDMRGASTPTDATDDLEIVDEVSYEQDRGWEYDVDGRLVDVGSASDGLPQRRVHALDDPQGFNPDAISRVDYRCKGAGWTPVAGASGQSPGGNNWQDTATEQWIRGETLNGSAGAGSAPWFYYSNEANSNPDAIQPYATNVPLWLADGAAAEFNFSVDQGYQIMAGRLNPLSIALLPGDSDRDGDADADDIAKTAAVFGDPDWIFSNSFAGAPEGADGDPATQTRPWDVDLTGDNGIEPSDLQWTLNFQGDTTGRVFGVTYDSTTPSATGVRLNANAGVAATLSMNAALPNGGSLSHLSVGDTLELTVLGQVTSGANNAAAQQNGVMQFAHDLTISSAGVLRVIDVQPAAPFAITRAALIQLRGVDGDLGVELLNGYTTSFTVGLTGANSLYTVTIEAIGEGSANVSITPAAASRFAESTPGGLKVGHTDHNGDPATVSYPAALSVIVTSGAACNVACPGDIEPAGGDGDVDLTDIAVVLANFGTLNGATCDTGDVEPASGDGDVDLADLAVLLANYDAVCQ